MTRFKSPLKGRGALSNRDSRYNATARAPVDDSDWPESEEVARTTSVTMEEPRAVLSYNRSPDIPFDRSINPYRGCEHGCIYCYARPTHAYLGLSPGLDFETRLVVKRGAASVLGGELSRRGYACRPIALGANTDPYQPIERSTRSTREILQLLHDCHHPVTITTKSSLVERDLDLLVPMANRRLVTVQISLTTLDKELARIMEPRATSPARRLQSVVVLSQAGIPTKVMVAPVIPFINDGEIETLLSEAARAGARGAGYVILRLPNEIAELFREWLETHFPLKSKRVLNCLQQIHGGKIYRAEFGVRQSGTGVFAGILRQRFSLACKKHGLWDREGDELDTTQFVAPQANSRQLDMFHAAPGS